MVKVEYANAYKEVLDILKYVSKEDFDKIPAKKIKMFSKYANYDYDFEYNPEITLKEQNVSDIAQTIIAILFRDYWATSEQREKILSKEKYDMQLLEEYKKEKYNSNIIFDNKYRINNRSSEEKNQETSLVDVSNIKWYKKIWKSIKNILKIR